MLSKVLFTGFAILQVIAAVPQGYPAHIGKAHVRDLEKRNGGNHGRPILTLTTTFMVPATATIYESSAPGLTTSVTTSSSSSTSTSPAAAPTVSPTTTTSSQPANQAQPTASTTATENTTSLSSTSLSTQSSSTTNTIPTPRPTSDVMNGIVTEDIVRAIMPKAGSCNNAPFPTECRTAEQAFPYFSLSFGRWKIYSNQAQAAILALVAFETGELKYAKAHFGDTPPGKGTRNMQYPNFNKEYATVLFGADAIAAKDPAAILEAIQVSDVHDFGSAAWFLSTKCPSVLAQFATNPNQAWTAYLGAGCIGTTQTAERDVYWEKAKKALGVS